MKKLFLIFAAIGLFMACSKDNIAEKAVDLGLSVKWATCNIGASKPEDFGGYYSWGETATKEKYSWSTYKFGTSESGPFSKYNTNSSYGTVDNKTVLDPEDDVAHVKLGGKWRMPTDAEFTELRNTDNCTWEWTTMNGVNGYKVTSKKEGYTDKWIFLPAAGYRSGTSLDDAGSFGSYWSSSLNTDYPDVACSLDFYSSDVSRNYYYGRYLGPSVRPVTAFTMTSPAPIFDTSPAKLLLDLYRAYKDAR